MQRLFQRTRLRPPAYVVPTFPSWAPQRAIDHILVGDGLRCGGLQAMPASFSDHLAVALDLEVPDRCMQ